MRTSLIFLATALIALPYCYAQTAEVADTGCHDSIAIDTITYEVPSWWCPYKIDSAGMADPVSLVRLPERFCELDYRIYLERTTRNALVVMAKAALQDSLHLKVRSGYRSPEFQLKLLRRRLDSGQPFRSVMWAVAPPGYSQHHTGRAVDLTSAEEVDLVFSARKAYRWLRENADRFGFSETFGPDIVHPPASEPWHWYYSSPDPVIDSSATDN